MTTTFKRIVPTDTYEVRVDGVLVGTVARQRVHNSRTVWFAFDVDGRPSGRGYSRGVAVQGLVSE